MLGVERVGSGPPLLAVPRGELVLLAGQGHTMIDADPGGFVAEVDAFFGSEG